MPYVITTTPGDVREAEERNGARLTGIMDGSQPATPDSEAATRDALAKLDRMKSRRAVATLDEARKQASREFKHHQVDTPYPDLKADIATRKIPESGGTVGPLPDGTVIEVEPCDRFYLLRALGRDEHSSVTTDEIIDAYNAAQAAAVGAAS